MSQTDSHFNKKRSWIDGGRKVVTQAQARRGYSSLDTRSLLGRTLISYSDFTQKNDRYDSDKK